MISIDTDIMKQLVQATSNANDAIDTAVDVLNRITIHNDWGCKEKNKINEYTTTNKNKIKAIQGNSRSFLTILNSVSADFETSENKIKDMFQSIEGLLGKVLSGAITPIIHGTPAPNPISSAVGIVASVLKKFPTGYIPFNPTRMTVNFSLGENGQVVVTPIENTTQWLDPVGEFNSAREQVAEKTFRAVPIPGINEMLGRPDLISSFEKLELNTIRENITPCEYVNFSNLGSSVSE